MYTIVAKGLYVETYMRRVYFLLFFHDSRQHTSVLSIIYFVYFSESGEQLLKIVGVEWTLLQSSIHVKWQPARFPASHSGTLQGYRVKYAFLNVTMQERTVITKIPEFHLIGLKPNTRVRFDIAAMSSCGIAGPESTFFQTTGELISTVSCMH